ncbi:family 1 glycosylhydrolase [Paraburkholderia strydomiana]|uniref:family 1 glycosylhydrolase n=1 Tax=Paraburkholderia strydomiana TaxID=1245417 RepID=UPI0038B9C7F6
MHRGIALWGGLECTVNRVRDRFFDQLDRSGHATRETDLERFASLGISALRYPVLWERTAPHGMHNADWTWPDARLTALRRLGVEPIAGLLHHGSGPLPGGLLDPHFTAGLAAFARSVAQRYPWLTYYTPVNEPNTTARFCALYGFWHPHATDDRSYLQALINQCKATVCAMREIRCINPDAKLVQTDDLGRTEGTPAMAALVDFYNVRRWLSWDLLCGLVAPGHPLWEYITGAGIRAEDVLWFLDSPCPPDIIGINYYITSERWLDDRSENFPPAYRCDWYGQRLADIEAARAVANPLHGVRTLLDEAWERYRLPLAVTEAHIDATRQDQMRWLDEIWTAASDARKQGADVRAVTVWALLGSYDWNCLVTEDRGYYEPGAFDVRAAEPRETAIAPLMRDLAAGRRHEHPALHGAGWWRRAGRFLCEPIVDGAMRTLSPACSPAVVERRHQAPPLLLLGDGALSRAFRQTAEQRDLHCSIVPLPTHGKADERWMESALEQYAPWAVIRATDPVDVDEAEKNPAQLLTGITDLAVTAAHTCARRNLPYLTFSTDLVFDGLRRHPYIETDSVAPLNRYGDSMADMERRVLAACKQALVVRTGELFGLQNDASFLSRALELLSRAQPAAAAEDVTVSPTYTPDLVHACLDLLIDAEVGLLHLSNGGASTWAELAIELAKMTGLNAALVHARPACEIAYVAARPAYSALTSRRAAVLPSLADALLRYSQAWCIGRRRGSPGAN